jgi:hypothetical protein
MDSSIVVVVVVDIVVVVSSSFSWIVIIVPVWNPFWIRFVPIIPYTFDIDVLLSNK